MKYRIWRVVEKAKTRSWGVGGLLLPDAKIIRDKTFFYS